MNLKYEINTTLNYKRSKASNCLLPKAVCRKIVCCLDFTKNVPENCYKCYFMKASDLYVYTYMLC